MSPAQEKHSNSLKDKPLMLPRLTARERINAALQEEILDVWACEAQRGLTTEVLQRVIDGAAVEALRIAREMAKQRHEEAVEVMRAAHADGESETSFDFGQRVQAAESVKTLDDLLTVLVGGSQVVDNKEDHGAGLIHQVASPLAETLPRPNVKERISAKVQIACQGADDSRYQEALVIGGAREALLIAKERGTLLKYPLDMWEVVSGLLIELADGNQAATQSSGDNRGSAAQKEHSHFASPEAPREEKNDAVCTDGYCSACGAIALMGADYCENHEPSPPLRDLSRHEKNN